MTEVRLSPSGPFLDIPNGAGGALQVRNFPAGDQLAGTYTLTFPAAASNGVYDLFAVVTAIDRDAIDPGYATLGWNLNGNAVSSVAATLPLPLTTQINVPLACPAQVAAVVGDVLTCDLTLSRTANLNGGRATARLMP